jgi:hypothetical protein
MDVGVIGEETLLRGVEEVCSMVDAGLLGGRAAEDLWLPGVEMRVKVDDTDWAVLADDWSVMHLVHGFFSFTHRLIERSKGKVIVWSPPRVIRRGKVLPFLEGPGLSASVWGARLNNKLCPSSIC